MSARQQKVNIGVELNNRIIKRRTWAISVFVICGLVIFALALLSARIWEGEQLKSVLQYGGAMGGAFICSWSIPSINEIMQKRDKNDHLRHLYEYICDIEKDPAMDAESKMTEIEKVDETIDKLAGVSV